jgi:PHP domain.
MQEFKYDTHVHTSESSACGQSSGAEIARRYQEAGFTGIIITDHYFGGNTAVPRDLDWEQRIDLFSVGYENAKAEGEKIGLSVFFGLEAGFSGTEFLTYGVDKAWLKQNPDMMSWDTNEFLSRVRAAGGFVSHAHPFRQRGYITQIRLFPDLVDAAEVYNCGHNSVLFDDRANWYCDSYGLLKTSGSDTHTNKVNKFGGMIFDRALCDIEDFISAVRNKETVQLIKGETYE